MNQNDLPPYVIKDDKDDYGYFSKVLVLPPLSITSENRQIIVGGFPAPDGIVYSLEFLNHRPELNISGNGLSIKGQTTANVHISALNRAQLWALSEAIQALLCEHPCTLEKG